MFKTVVSDAESMFGKVASVAGGVFAGNLLTRGFDAFKNGITSSIRLSSDFNESANKSKEVFGAAFDEIKRFGEAAPQSLGLSQRAALDATGTFGNMFNQLRIGTRDSAQMSETMVQLASDFASFHNADITQVIQAQTSAFRGEYDALQRFLPTITAAAVAQKAMEMTGKTNANQLNAQEKALATYRLMLDGAGKAQGDFARTSDGTANATRRAGASFEELKRVVGQEFEPTWNRVINSITQRVQSQEFQQGVRDWAQAIRGFVGDFDRGFRQVVVPTFEWVVSNKAVLVTAITAIGVAFAWTNPIGVALVGIAGSLTLIGNIAKNGIDLGPLGKIGGASKGPSETAQLQAARDFINEGTTPLVEALRAFQSNPKFAGVGFGPSGLAQIDRLLAEQEAGPAGGQPVVPPQPGPDVPTMPYPDWTPLETATKKLVDVFMTAGDTLRGSLSKVDEAINGLFSRPSREQAEMNVRLAEDKLFKAQFGDKAVHFGPGEGKGTPEKQQKLADTLAAQHDLEKARLVVLDATLKTEAQLELDRAELAKKIPGFTQDIQNAATALGANLTPGMDAFNTAISGPSGAVGGINSMTSAALAFVNFVKRNIDPNADTLTPGGTFDREGKATGLTLAVEGPGR